jgi:hypothetical protein
MYCSELLWAFENHSAATSSLISSLHTLDGGFGSGQLKDAAELSFIIQFVLVDGT